MVTRLGLRGPALAGGLLVVSLALVCGCQSGPTGAHKNNLNALLAEHEYASAEQVVRTAQETEYGEQNLVLFYLDLGVTLFHQERFLEADNAFDIAEKKIEDLYTTSVSRAAGQFLVNDTTVEYPGEPFERALMSTYRALDWVGQGKREDAAVEARKVGLFLDVLSRAEGQQSKYTDDALAQYLSGLLFEDIGKPDDARISFQRAEKAWQTYSTLYGHGAPRFPNSRPSGDRSSGELVLVHFNGTAPLKSQRTLQFAWNDALVMAKETSGDSDQKSKFDAALTAGISGNAITLAFPQYEPRPVAIQAAEVMVDGDQRGVPLELVEDVQAIAVKTLADRMDAIKARAVARATIKFVLAKAAAKLAEEACDKLSNAILVQGCKWAANGTAMAAAAASESADARCWGSLPAQVRMARIQLEPGKHRIQIRANGAAGEAFGVVDLPEVVVKRGERTYLTYRTGGTLLAARTRPAGAPAAASSQMAARLPTAPLSGAVAEPPVPEPASVLVLAPAAVVTASAMTVPVMAAPEVIAPAVTAPVVAATEVPAAAMTTPVVSAPAASAEPQPTTAELQPALELGAAVSPAATALLPTLLTEQPQTSARLAVSLSASPAYTGPAGPLRCFREKDCPGQDACLRSYCVRDASAPQSCEREKDCPGTDTCKKKICVRYYDPEAGQ